MFLYIISSEVLQRRASIGNFYHSTHPLIRLRKTPFCGFNYVMKRYCILHLTFLLKTSSRQSNLGPSKKCLKVTLEAYNTIHKYNCISISETYLDSIFVIYERDLSIYGYNLLRADRPSVTKGSSVSIYYKKTLAVKILNVTNLAVCLLCVAVVQRRVCCCCL